MCNSFLQHRYDILMHTHFPVHIRSVHKLNIGAVPIVAQYIIILYVLHNQGGVQK